MRLAAAHGPARGVRGTWAQGPVGQRHQVEDHAGHGFGPGLVGDLAVLQLAPDRPQERRQHRGPGAPGRHRHAQQALHVAQPGDQHLGGRLQAQHVVGLVEADPIGA